MRQPGGVMITQSSLRNVCLVLQSFWCIYRITDEDRGARERD
jgi:hypothetical protein